MRSLLLSFNEKIQALLIISITIMLAFAVALFLRLFFDPTILISNSDLIISVYQVIGTIYAILLTFTLWGVWQNFANANVSVQNEAYALLDMVHMLDASSSWQKDEIRSEALVYARTVVKQEWPLLKNISTQTINLQYSRPLSLKLVEAVQLIKPVGERDDLLFGQVLSLLNNWLDARRSRILIARGNSAKQLWPLLIIGALMLFAIHGLFVAKTLGIWSFLLFAISLVISVTFYLIFSLDCPFGGSLSIDPEPFLLAVSTLEQEKV